MKKLIYIVALVPILAIAQSPDQNWVKSKTYKDSTKISIASPTAAQAVTQVSYFDGLGRPIQQVAHAQSNSGKDIVTHIEYDALGRQVREYLPFVSSTGASLNIKTDETISFYGSNNVSLTGNPNFEITQFPFSEKQFESSPLNRVLKQAAPGEAWKLTSGNEIEFEYQTNETNDSVRLYKATTTWNLTLGLYDIAFVSDNFYANNQLYKTITKDENHTSGNNNTTQEFKDKEGQVVLKRTYNDNIAHDTYYVYDQFGNLTYVIPPAVSGTIDQVKLDNMCYQYKYDYRNRLVEKKLPSKQLEYIVYDKLDRVVATGPAYNPYGATTESNKGWMLTKYDGYNRPVYTGWYNTAVANSADRKSLQDTYNIATLFSESKTTSANTINGISTRYSNLVSPSTFILLSVNYYDTYDYPNAPTPFPTSVESQSTVTNVKGMPTGSWVRILDVANSTTNELSYTIYDNKYRPVRSYTQNYLGGYTQVDSKIDWAGKTEYTLTKHKLISSSTELTTKDMFEYSAQDKLVKHKHKINALSEQLLSYNTYDELGQLISKKVGGADVTGANAFQKVDYSYNIRGWLKSINDVANLAPTSTENDLFAFKLNYNNPDNAVALYNGNISETFWRTDSDNTLRKYEYSYDNLNRLLEANYKKPGMTLNVDSYLEKLTYDKNGNILSLKRNGDLDASNFAIQIDDLEYTYHDYKKNELVKVLDKSNHPQGFKDDANGVVDSNNDYVYDANGNMITDHNKSIKIIKYNHLNLPIEIVFENGNLITYLYNSLGQKIKKNVQDQTTTSVVTNYMSGGFQYVDNVLSFFPHSEGYVNVTLGRKGNLLFNYVFQFKDHLGNNRLSYTFLENQIYIPGGPLQFEILEENHYYPFGLKHTSYNTNNYEFVEVKNGNDYYVNVVQIRTGVTSSYKYKYNGKELQDELGLNVTALDWRQYDSAIGRFVTIDPETDELEQLDKSPYAFAWNNPVLYNDPDGRNPIKNFLKKMLKAFGDDGVKLVAKTSKGNLKPISRVHAEKLLKQGKTVMKTTDGSSNISAKKLMKSASDKSKVVRHDGHELLDAQGNKTGKTGLDHYQKKSGDGSHVLYNNAKKTVAVGATASNGDEVAKKALSAGATITNSVENFGTNVFGNNEFGKFVDEINPLNIGFSGIFKLLK